MKPYVVIGIAVVLVFAATYYAVYVPPRKSGYMGLTYSWHGWQTNERGQVMYKVGISNSSRNTVRVNAEIVDPVRGAMPYVGMYQLPASESIVLYPRAAAGDVTKQVVVGVGQKIYRMDWRGRVEFYFDSMVLKRPGFELAHPNQERRE